MRNEDNEGGSRGFYEERPKRIRSHKSKMVKEGG